VLPLFFMFCMNSYYHEQLLTRALKGSFTFGGKSSLFDIVYLKAHRKSVGRGMDLAITTSDKLAVILQIVLTSLHKQLAYSHSHNHCALKLGMTPENNKIHSHLNFTFRTLHITKRSIF
jgi:galactose-1-phosphate uridylyltransferase